MEYIKLAFGIVLTITLTWMLFRNSILPTYISERRGTVDRKQGGKWGMNSVVPTKEKSVNQLFTPSAFSTVVVAVGLLVFGLIELGSIGIFSDGMDLKYFRWGNLLIAFIFLARAVGDFNYVGFFKKVKGTVFAKNDSRYYAPLCLFIAIASLFVALG